MRIAILLLLVLTGCVEVELIPIEPEAPCTARLEVLGEHIPSLHPDDIHGCKPLGVWKFSAQVASSNCPHDIALEPEYSFLVALDDQGNERYRYLNDPNDPNVRIKVTSGGGGLCEGGLELVTETTFLNLKPALQRDNVINGFGEYDYAASVPASAM